MSHTFAICASWTLDILPFPGRHCFDWTASAIRCLPRLMNSLADSSTALTKESRTAFSIVALSLTVKLTTGIGS